MTEEFQLSSSETEKLLQFQDLTGIEDMQECRRLLESHSWNLEAAVQDTLNIREGTPSVYNSASDVAPPVVNDAIDQRHYNSVITQRPRGFFNWIFYISSLPVYYLFNSLLNIIVYTLNLFRPDPRQNIVDPASDVISFISSYNEKYSRQHPVFYQGSYSQALNDAKRELKFLLVYLHCDSHQHTQDFCLNTLANQNVIDYINSHMLFWACSVDVPEGYRVSQALREYTYPFLAVIVLRQNKMTIVAKIEGAVEPEALIDELQHVITDNEASLIVARADRDERSLNQTLRREQDEAYLESLRADQEKERKKVEVQQQRQQQEEELQKQQQEQEEKKEELIRRKRELIGRIPEEPDDFHPEAIRILLKLPCGTRLERKFLRSDSLKSLYYFVLCHEQTPDNFEIVTNFPRRVLLCSPPSDENADEPPTFAGCGLGRSEMLFVNDLDA